MTQYWIYTIDPELDGFFSNTQWSPQEGILFGPHTLESLKETAVLLQGMGYEIDPENPLNDDEWSPMLTVTDEPLPVYDQAEIDRQKMECYRQWRMDELARFRKVKKPKPSEPLGGLFA